MLLLAMFSIPAMAECSMQEMEVSTPAPSEMAADHSCCHPSSETKNAETAQQTPLHPGVSESQTMGICDCELDQNVFQLPATQVKAPSGEFKVFPAAEFQQTAFSTVFLMKSLEKDPIQYSLGELYPNTGNSRLSYMRQLQSWLA